MAQAVEREDVRVDVSSIEKQLAELWRAENSSRKDAVTRAALWNVVAHTWTSEQHAHAAEVLARASESVPQRTIVVRAEPHGEAAISSWISANCHLVGGDRQVCSEEVSIAAAGERVPHLVPLVKALLLPDMPVAVWWVGDLPDDPSPYAETLLDPADRLIVDSSHFDRAEDLDVICRIAERTATAPADLNWARLEEWRAATATLFDPQPFRARLRAIRTVRVTSGASDFFGARAAALLYAAWLLVQSGSDARFELVQEGDAPGIRAVELHLDDSSTALIRREREESAVIGHWDASETKLDCVARPLAHATEDLIVRLLKKPEADRVYLAALRKARELGG